MPTHAAPAPNAWHAPLEPLEPRAAWSLALALASWFAIPLAPAIVALVIGRQAQVRMSVLGTTGEGLVTAARVLSWMNIALWAGVIVGSLILLVAFGTYAGLSAAVDAILPAA